MSAAITLRGLDLIVIADSGQCFRMTRDGDGYMLYSGDRRVLVTSLGDDRYSFSCGEDELRDFWLPYLDEGTDYDALLGLIDPDDAALNRAAGYGRGLRILRQDPFEALICFIISQRRSIPSIRTCVAKLCEAFGARLSDERGEYFAFPTPAALAQAGEDAILACRVGYRAKYILSCARRFASGELTTDGLSALCDASLREKLLSLYGVGEKVAACAMLFGFHRLDAFPVDVWVSRVEKRYYGGRFPRERYQGVSGVMQQYLFYAVIGGVIEG